MTAFYKAIIDDDRIELRSTEGRTYVACVAVEWRKPGSNHNSGYVTWCGTSERADREIATNRAKGRIATRAAAIEITAAEYRALKRERK